MFNQLLKMMLPHLSSIRPRIHQSW